MKHLHTRSPVVRSLVVATVGAIMTGACARERPAPGGDTVRTADTGVSPPPTTIAACAISSDSVRRLTRRQFVMWASRIEYDSSADSTGRTHDPSIAGDPGIAGIRVHRMRGMDRVTRAELEDGCLIARVRSPTAYPALGLGRGWTYVWADSTNPYTATMVPEQEGVAVTEFRLSLEPDEPAPGTIASPRYICSDCGNDWCVYPRDTFQSEPALFSPGE